MIKKRCANRIRAKIRGTKEKPRLSIFRSNKHIFLQLIDDETGKTLASASDLKINPPVGGKISKTEIAKETGKLLAGSAKEKKIKKIVFDRGKYKYHGRVRAAAEGMREGGLKL